MAEAQATESLPSPLHLSDATFDTFSIDAIVREAILARGYTRATHVQAAVIPEALAGHDLLVQSKTGSGKTSAFGVPLVNTLAPTSASSRHPLALVLAPTRELAGQVADELTSLGTLKGVRVLAVYGGMPLGRQAQRLEEGVEIVVGTPGRIADHVRRGGLNLGSVKHVVLDEADEMLSMGFWETVTELLALVPDSAQTMLFSATLPYAIAKTAAELLRDPKRIDLSGDELTVQGITNYIVNVHPDIPKPRQLLYVLETQQPESAIIFCNTRNETEMIAKYLTQAGFIAEALSGNFRQRERERVMDRIKRRELRYMVATDVVSRGIDISHLSHVYNYALPEFSEVYVHRVGRTGRMGRLGSAVSLLDGKGMGTLSLLEREFGIHFEPLVLPAEAEILHRRSLRIMKELSEKASVSEVTQHMPVAQEVLAATDAQQVVAFLLKNFFGKEAERSRDRRPEPEQQAGSSPRPVEHAQDAGPGMDGGQRRRRRRGRRGRRGGREFETIDAVELVDVEAVARPVAPEAAPEPAVLLENLPPAPDGMHRVRVNIGFDDGFKGRGSVAKKVSALAGINDGIISEVEARRDHSVLEASQDIIEMLIDRVDGAQIGKKIVTVHALSATQASAS